jgi:sulfur transfer protein SufE
MTRPIAPTCCSTTPDKFKTVPPSVATRPYARDHLVPHCESEAYVWAVKNPDGTLKLHFAVENASGISPKRWRRFSIRRCRACLLKTSPRSRPTWSRRSFAQNISMGKGMGLMSMVQAVRALAKSAS